MSGFQRGSSLIEVLIAVLVMSISLFGFLEYFSQTRRNLNSQVGLVAAQYIGEFLLASVRQHSNSTNQGLYSNMSVGKSYTLHSCSNVPCSSEKIAERDLALFVGEANKNLNSPAGQLSFVNGYVRLDLFWSDPLRPVRNGECEDSASVTQSCITLYKSLI